MEVVRDLLTELHSSANEVLQSLTSFQPDKDELSQTTTNAGTLLNAITALMEDFDSYSSTYGPDLPLDELEALVLMAGKIVESVESLSHVAASPDSRDGQHSGHGFDFIDPELGLLFRQDDSEEVYDVVLHDFLFGDDSNLKGLNGVTLKEPFEVEESVTSVKVMEVVEPEPGSMVVREEVKESQPGQETIEVEVEVLGTLQMTEARLGQDQMHSEPVTNVTVETGAEEKVTSGPEPVPEYVEQLEHIPEVELEPEQVPVVVAEDAEIQPVEEAKAAEEEEEEEEVEQLQVAVMDNDDFVLLSPIEEMMGATGNEPMVCYIKTPDLNVPPVEANLFFTGNNVNNQEVVEASSMIQRAQLEVITRTPGQDRIEHFDINSPWIFVPATVNESFQSSLHDTDSARIYETLVAAGQMVFPLQENNDERGVTYKIAFLCPPSGGVVSGAKMFLDLTQRQLNVEWIALTTHPWKETQEVDKIVLDDINLFWEHQNWRFLLKSDLMIRNKDEMMSIANNIRMGIGYVDLLVADLSAGVLDEACSANNIVIMRHELKKAILTECGQLEVALLTLRDGGSLILSLVDPTGTSCTVGNIAILAGLFKKVLVVFPRPSVDWIRPASLVCSGYVGVKVFKSTYPNFSASYFDAIVDNFQRGNRQVLLDLANVPEEIANNIANMTTAWAEQEDPRLRAFIASFGNNQVVLRAHIQTTAAQRWVTWCRDAIAHNPRQWNVAPIVPFVMEDLDHLDDLRDLWTAESFLNLFVVRSVLTRLCQSYIQTTFTPVFLNSVLNLVNTTKWDAIVREQFPRVISFSRFVSLQVIYDRYIVRSVAQWFPTDGFAESIDSGVPVTCISHARNNVRACLASHFQLHIERDAFIVDCLNVPISRKLEMSETDFHKYLVLMILKHLKDLDRGDTLFLCKCPLFTRLILAMMCLANNCFKEIRLIVCDEMRLAGVLFINFKGSRNEIVHDMRERFQHILNEINQNNIDMEPVPLSSILRAFNMESLMEYNNVVLRGQVKSITNVLLGKLKQNHKAVPQY